MRIMVLNDGETYTDLRGCLVLEFPDGDTPYDSDVKRAAFMAHSRPTGPLDAFVGENDNAVTFSVVARF